MVDRRGGGERHRAGRRGNALAARSGEQGIPESRPRVDGLRAGLGGGRLLDFHRGCAWLAHRGHGGPCVSHCDLGGISGRRCAGRWGPHLHLHHGLLLLGHHDIGVLQDLILVVRPAGSDQGIEVLGPDLESHVPGFVVGRQFFLRFRSFGVQDQADVDTPGPREILFLQDLNEVVRERLLEVHGVVADDVAERGEVRVGHA